MKRVRCRILQIYRVAGVSHPMMVHFRDDTIRSRCDAADIDTKRSCEITGSGTKSCVYELFSAFVSEIYSPAFSEKVSHDSSADFFTIVFVAMGKKARHHHEQSDPTLTRILSPIGTNF